MPWIEKEGRTVEEALAAALAELGLPEADTEVEVLREGAKGLFGLGGEAALVRVRPRSEARDVRGAFHDRPPADKPDSREPDTDEEEGSEEEGSDAVQEAFEAEQAQALADEDELEGAPGMSLSERQQVTTDVAVEMVKGILERMGLKGDVNTRVAGGTVYVEVFGDEMGILIGRGGKTLEALQELVRAGVQRRLKARAAVVVDVEAYWERRRESGRREGRREGGRREGGRREGSGGRREGSHPGAR